MFSIGLSSCGKVLNGELLHQYQAAGIGNLEISLPPQETETLDYPALRRLADSFGVKLWSLHLPFYPFASNDISQPALAEATVAYHGAIIARAAQAGIDTFVIHPSGEPIAEADRPARMACAKESLAKLAEVAAKYGAVICVEDLPRTCLGRDSDDILELLSADDRLRVCLDTNHLLKEDLVDFIHRVGDKIVTTHISDYDFVDERHWLPGEGGLDWQKVAAALEEVGYSGPWLYELGFKAPASMSRPRDLNCEDFVNNAYEIFHKVPLTVLGTKL